VAHALTLYTPARRREGERPGAALVDVDRNRGDARASRRPTVCSGSVKAHKKQTQTCRLPGTLFPSRPERRVKLELEPGEGVTHAFDPRLYCFAAGGQWLLVPGSVVTPHFGWKQKTKARWSGGKKIEEPVAKQSAPFVAGSADEDEDEVPARSSSSPSRSRLPGTRVVAHAIEQERRRKLPFEMKITQGSTRKPSAAPRSRSGSRTAASAPGISTSGASSSATR
jgi:hypothetical protein